MVDHAISLSDERFHHENLEIVRKILSNNCFPSKIIKRHIHKRIKFLKQKNNNNSIDKTDELNKSGEKTPTNTEDNTGESHKPVEKTTFMSLPYMNNLSENMAHSFKKFGIDVFHTLPKKLNSIIKSGKDRLSNDRSTNVVYKIDCNNCSATYIGQTKRHLSTRFKEHQKNIKLDVTSHSVISKHRLEYGHDFDWNGFNILHTEKHVKKREIAEMFFIKKQNNNINSQRDTENLNDIYNKIIKVV